MATSLNKCTGCGERFPPGELISVPAGKFHSWECATKYATDKKNKKTIKEVADKVKRNDIKKRKEKLKPPSKWLSEAQKWFNKFIRLRDKDDLCISCNRTIKQIQGNDNWKVGGAWDCGHYLTRGAHPELRFEELNAHKQCKSCNGGSGNFSSKSKTVGEKYRVKLIKKIGIENVEWIEGPHEPKKYTIDDLKEIIATYKAKCKELEQCN
jgi:hypothetical protein